MRKQTLVRGGKWDLSWQPGFSLATCSVELGVPDVHHRQKVTLTTPCAANTQYWSQLRDQAARVVCSLRQRGLSEPSPGLPQWISHAMFLLFVIAVCHVLGQGITISLLVCLLHKTRKMWKMVECGKSWKENCLKFLFFRCYVSI